MKSPEMYFLFLYTKDDHENESYIYEEYRTRNDLEKRLADISNTGGEDLSRAFVVKGKRIPFKVNKKTIVEIAMED